MAVCRLYVDANLEVGRDVTLPAEQRHYLKHVMRCASGDALVVFNGRGGEYHATLMDDGGMCHIGGFDAVERELACAVHIVQSASRSERLEWMLQKATELGAASFTLVRSERAMLKLAGSRLEKRLQRWRKIVMEACEQSGRTRIPRVEWCERLAIVQPESDNRWFLHPDSEGSWLQVRDSFAVCDSVTLAVGPEGGFSPADIAILNRLEFRPLQFGSRILRTETAAPALLAAIQAVFDPCKH